MGFKDKLGQMASSAMNSAKETTINAVNSAAEKHEIKKTIKTIGPLQVREEEKLFHITGKMIRNEKKSHGLTKAVLATATMGMSSAVNKAIKQNELSNEWFEFDDLIGYELLEDDNQVVTGGVGKALVGGLIFGGAGAIAGAAAGTKKHTRKVETLLIKVTLNSFDTPSIIIPLITGGVKTDSPVYKSAYVQAQQILATLDVITHNK